MEIAHILEELSYEAGELPREAIEAAVARRSDITPHLLNILQEASVRVEELVENDSYHGHLYAMYLLAQFREERAYPLILKLISHGGDIPHAIAGDVLTEDMGRILASVSGGVIAPLTEVIENQSLNEYVRAAAMGSLVVLVGCRLQKRGTVMAYLASLFQKLEDTPSFVWDTLICACCDLHPQEVYSSICAAFERGLIDTSFISLEEVSTTVAKEMESHLLALGQSAELIEDTVTEMEKWLSPQLS